MIEQMMRSTAFDKITAVYGHIDENGLFVRKWLARKIPITDKMVKNSCLSVKCVLITDKSAKKGTLSVILSEILACLPEQEKIRANHGTDLNHYSVERSALHLHNQAQTSNKAHDKFVPLRDCACADHSRPSLSTALLGGWSSHLHNRAHDRSLPHLYISTITNPCLPKRESFSIKF